MDAKLTLKLDKQVIDQAKLYAASHKKSLSRMVESYLQSLIEKENLNEHDDLEISPFVKSMQSGVKVPLDVDHKEIYGNHLDEKYQ